MRLCVHNEPVVVLQGEGNAHFPCEAKACMCSNAACSTAGISLNCSAEGAATGQEACKQHCRPWESHRLAAKHSNFGSVLIHRNSAAVIFCEPDVQLDQQELPEPRNNSLLEHVFAVMLMTILFSCVGLMRCMCMAGLQCWLSLYCSYL